MKISIRVLIRSLLNNHLLVLELLTRLLCKLKFTIKKPKKYVHKKISNVFVPKAVYNWNKMNLIVIRDASDTVARSFKRNISRGIFYPLAWFLQSERKEIFLETSKKADQLQRRDLLSSAIDPKICCYFHEKILGSHRWDVPVPIIN